MVDTSAGYDSNPAEAEDASGSAFTRHSLSLFWESPKVKEVAMTLSPSVVYSNYFEVEDSHEIGLEAALTSGALGRRIRPSLVAGVLFYRDNLIETDERNEVKMGLAGDWLVSNRFSLFLKHAWLWTHYLSDNTAFGHGKRQSGKMSGRAGQGQEQAVYPARDDTGTTSQFSIEMLVSPSFTVSTGLTFEQVNSSLDEESFRKIVPGIQLLWDPAPFWQLLLDLGMEQLNYNHVDASEQDIRRINDTRTLEIKVSRLIGNWELFTDFYQEWGERPLFRENFHRREVQCGLSWSF